MSLKWQKGKIVYQIEYYTYTITLNINYEKSIGSKQ